MKKIFKLLALALCPVLFAVACDKEIDVVNNEESTELQASRVITLVYPSDPETKVSFAEDGKTAWEAGDEILIHGQKIGHSGEEYYSRVVTLSAGDISVDGKTATFTLESIVADKSWGRTGYKANLFAAYPASAVKSVSDGTSWYYSTGFDTNDILLLGGCNDTSVNDGNTFTFMHLSGVLSFVVSGDFDSYEFSGNAGTEVLGYDVFSARVDQQTTFGDKNAIPYSGSGGGIGCSGAKTTLTGSLVADGSTVNHIFFPGGVNLSTGFTLKFLKGGVEQKRVGTNTAKNIAMGKYLKLGDVTSHLYTYVPPATHDASHPAIAGATDLSATASANCYIVDGGVASNAEKVFKFKAYKGNSTTNVGTINNVVVLWETYNNETSVTTNSIIAQVDYDKQSENDFYEIAFKMPETLHAGNAVIAAKDKNDEILWSWHIWVPETTVEDVDASDICNATAMDRNLGALRVTETGTDVVATIESFGLMYQWGRKDPFPGAKRVNSSTLALVAGASFSLKDQSLAEWSDIEHVAGTMTLEESIKNPTVFGNNSGGDWDEAATADRWSKTTKTIYDPCPPGYRVMKRETSSVLWNTTNIATAATSAGLTWESSRTGHWFKIVDGVNVLTFPLAGYIDDSVVTTVPYLSYIGDRAAVYAAYLSSGTDPYHLNIREDKTDYHKAGSTSCARGCSIRCVVEY